MQVAGFEFQLLTKAQLFQMKSKESNNNDSGGGSGGVFGPTKPLKKEGGLVSQIASKFQNNETGVAELKQSSNNCAIPPSVRHKKTSDSILHVKDPAEISSVAIKKTSLVSRTESHQARFNSARAMFEKMGSADDLDSISSNEKNRGSRASSVQRSRSTSPFNSKVSSVR